MYFYIRYSTVRLNQISFIMTNSFARFFYLTIILFLLLAASCHKDKTTIVNGTVVDKITGTPIQGARITFSVYHKDIPPPNHREFPSISSDQMGEFSFSNEDPLQILEISKAGYIFKGQGMPAIQRGEINEVKLEIIPKDGILKLNISNSTGLTDTIYYGIYSPAQEKEYAISHGVFFRESIIVEGLNSKTKIINLASEELISIYWDFAPLQFDIKTAPFHDSVYITRNDTTDFNISF